MKPIWVVRDQNQSEERVSEMDSITKIFGNSLCQQENTFQVYQI